MNGRSGLVTFFLFLFLVVMIVLQLLSMVQSDRLYERLNLLLDRLQSSRPARTVRVDTDGDGIRDKDGAAFRFKFMFPGGGGLGEKLIKLLQDEASKVGIEVISEPYEWSVFHERLINRDFDSFILGWSAPVLQDPYQLWHSSQVGSHGSNYVGFRNGEADGLIEEARRTLDDDRRNELYHQLHRLLHKEQPYTFLLTRPTLEFLDRRFENVRIKNLGVEPHEWYVPKEKQRYK